MGRLIKEMYSGKITERLNACPNSKKYKNLDSLTKYEIRHWESEMSEEEYERLESKLLKRLYKINEMEIKFEFELGFKLGAKLAIEMLGD